MENTSLQCSLSHRLSIKRNRISQTEYLQSVKCYDCNTQWKEVWTLPNIK